MAERQLSFMDSPHSDELAEFLHDFEFTINGFSLWDLERKEPVTEGFICHYQLAYISTGTLQVCVGDQVYRCTPGSLFLFSPFTSYRTEILPSASLRCYSIRFDVTPEHRKAEFFQTLQNQGGPLFSSQELPPMDGMFEDLYRCHTDRDLGMIFQVGVHLRLACLYMLRARWPKGHIFLTWTQPASTRKAEIIRESMEYIQTHLDKPLRIATLSASLNISENYLYKCFMEVLGVAPSRYFLQYKIRLSVELMTSSSLSMEAIAEQLGFSSLYHFSRAFKQIMGRSPRNYLARLSSGIL